jgi:hypothetical protein
LPLVAQGDNERPARGTAVSPGPDRRDGTSDAAGREMACPLVTDVVAASGAVESHRRYGNTS